jgi:hypothetical protein
VKRGHIPRRQRAERKERYRPHQMVGGYTVLDSRHALPVPELPSIMNYNENFWNDLKNALDRKREWLRAYARGEHLKPKFKSPDWLWWTDDGIEKYLLGVGGWMIKFCPPCVRSIRHTLSARRRRCS